MINLCASDIDFGLMFLDIWQLFILAIILFNLCYNLFLIYWSLQSTNFYDHFKGKWDIISYIHIFTFKSGTHEIHVQNLLCCMIMTNIVFFLVILYFKPILKFVAPEVVQLILIFLNNFCCFWSSASNWNISEKLLQIFKE